MVSLSGGGPTVTLVGAVPNKIGFFGYLLIQERQH